MKNIKQHFTIILFCLFFQQAIIFANEPTCSSCEDTFPTDYVYCPYCGKTLDTISEDEPLVLSDNTIVHLGNSAVLLKIAGRVLVFDYPCPTSSTERWYALQPEELVNERVYVFSSHSHGDHHRDRIYTWKDTIPNIKFILASDILSYPRGAIVVEPNQTIMVEDMKIRTYPSTDAGVAYSVYLDNKHIYFAGDNGFWNWKGDRAQKEYIEKDLAEVDRTVPMDIAFQVGDPLAIGVGDGGIGIFALTFQPKLLVPIHLRGQYEYLKCIEKQLTRRGFKNEFWVVKKPKDTITFLSD
jgi:L-ascorbate metabolism protein UlaG (beta-lactamase superfamily)